MCHDFLNLWRIEMYRIFVEYLFLDLHSFIVAFLKNILNDEDVIYSISSLLKYSTNIIYYKCMVKSKFTIVTVVNPGKVYFKYTYRSVLFSHI